MPRRFQLKTTSFTSVSALILMTLTCLYTGCGSGRDEPALQVLLVTVDTLNSAYLGCYGDPETRCPTMDRLARQGVLFAQSHSVINLTTPGHASIMTGVPPLTHEVYDNAVPISDRLETLAELFSHQGFATAAAVSSFQLNPELSNLGQGFDRFFLSDQHHLDATVPTGRLREWLGQEIPHRAFLWLHLFDCHAPYMPLPPYNQMYSPPPPIKQHPHTQNMDQPLRRAAPKQAVPPTSPLLDEPFLQRPPFANWYRGWLTGVQEVRTVTHRYRGTISEVDRQLELILHRMARIGGADRLLVVLTADHGESFGEHGIFFDHWGPYEPSYDVPLVLAGPGIPAGQVRSQLASTIDIAPTLAELVGLQQPATHSGVSLAGVIRDPTKAGREILVCEAAKQNAFTVRDREHKLIVPAKTRPFYPETEELYRISSDLVESRNLISGQAEDADHLRDRLAAWGKARLPAGSAPAPQPTRDESTLEGLRALGYLAD